MRRSVWVIAGLVVLAVLVLVGQPASQARDDGMFGESDDMRLDRLEREVDDLRDQVSDLEFTIERLERDVDAGANDDAPASTRPSGDDSNAPSESGRVSGTVNFIGDVGERVSISEVGCSGMGELADLAPGSVVTATDEEGTTAGTATLDEGPIDSDFVGRDVECAMPFEMDALPPAEGYRFQFGDERWLDVPYVELQRADFVVEISVY